MAAACLQLQTSCASASTGHVLRLGSRGGSVLMPPHHVRGAGGKGWAFSVAAGIGHLCYLQLLRSFYWAAFLVASAPAAVKPLRPDSLLVHLGGWKLCLGGQER